MECQFKSGLNSSGIYCPFTTILRSIKTFDPSDPMYFTPGNWRFLPDSEREYKIPSGGRFPKPDYNCHKCAGRSVGVKKRIVKPTVRSVGKAHQS